MQNPVDGADRGHRAGVADPLLLQLLANLPREHAAVLLLQPDDLLHHGGRGHLLEGKKDK